MTAIISKGKTGREDGVRAAETLKNVDNVLFLQLLGGFMGTGF